MSDAGKMRRLALGLVVLWPIVLGLAPAVAFAQGMMGDRGMMNGHGVMDGGMMGKHSPRHRYFMRHGLPAAYAKMANPLAASKKNIAAGKALYGQVCVVCHGAAGRGDGPVGKGMNPPPADLARMMHMPMASDGYLYWSIAEGGAQFGTSMPAMKGNWKPDQIWQVILYLRTL